ncbi:hypothetical protein SCALIN_C02_0012 [Candidatus Scalindua japonica]|uniref:PLD phosphodiesterase domain-containing protein n=1 Tax=Candidatus Scalindua japonica TaxID=1284222 RepID=A0A286TTZ3_9BACT|nr:hypothetical protein [Candidatus Scalindua japonica]GAX59333.1 hypothetical protein SCALIN_C02_0012 [Candidatus Scalindua japonica]
MKQLFIIILFVSISLKGVVADECIGKVDILPHLSYKYMAYEELRDISNEVKDYKRAVSNARKFHNQTDSKHVKYARDFEKRISPYIKSPAALYYLGNLNYDLQEKNISEEKKRDIVANIKRLLKYVFLNYQMMILELSKDPFLEDKPKLQKKVKKWKMEFSDDCIAFAKQIDEELLNEDPSTPKGRTRIIEDYLKQAPLVGEEMDFVDELKKYGLHHPGHVISPNGYIEGNRVELFNKNEWGKEQFIWYVKHKNVFKEHGYSSEDPPDGVKFYTELIKNNKSVFEEADTDEQIGFPGFEEHPGFKKGIFKELVEGIRSTSIGDRNATIFIDIFLLGETIGVVIAKEIVRAIERNPSLKVFILRDMENHYGHKENMVPVYNYLRAYSKHKPGNLIILPAELDLHPTGLADWMNYLIPEDAQEKFGNSIQLSPMAKADHSKIMVINGKHLDGSAVAYVASKNWLDTSGGINYDEVIKVWGPAATIIQDNYVPDMIAALIKEYKDPKTQKCHVNYLKLLYNAATKTKGLPLPRIENGSPQNSRGEKEDDIDYMLVAQTIVSDWDILNRKEGNLPDSLYVEKAGKTIINIGENNHNSHIRNALDQDIYLIENSTRKILVADQFYIEPRLVRATVEAAIDKKFDILLTSMPGPLGVMPDNFLNVAYLDLLLKHEASKNIRLRWKKLYRSGEMIQEFHMKTLTGGNENYDIHISGSANKGFMTMRGAFRETQVMIFQPAQEKGTIAQLAKNDFDKYFINKGGKCFSQILIKKNKADKKRKVDSKEKVPVEENVGAVEADLNYSFFEAAKSILKLINPNPDKDIDKNEAYKVFKKAREIGEALYNPYSFSLPPTKRTADE